MRKVQEASDEVILALVTEWDSNGACSCGGVAGIKPHARRMCRKLSILKEGGFHIAGDRVRARLWIWNYEYLGHRPKIDFKFRCRPVW